ncbi:hypothetical protein Rhal01_00011 [Rubritalea halochordaticola]|uniref:HTH tetR-type domain-containing protein n=1 Tax=Rubritalea halochordaticola TaxID=714537 RepID=A0ABP9UTN4_9BACT
MKGSKSSEATRERILEAAEVLFAERGFDGVSLRDITAAALANVAAVNYHFGTKEALMDQILLRYLVPLNQERLELLAEVEKREGGVEEILGALLKPLLGRMNEGGLQAGLFFKLMGRCMIGGGEHLPEQVKPVVQNVMGYFVKSLRRALPDFSEEELLWRMHFCVGTMMHAFLASEKLSDLTEGKCGEVDPEQMLKRLIVFCSAGLSAGQLVESPASLLEEVEEKEKSDEVAEVSREMAGSIEEPVAEVDDSVSGAAAIDEDNAEEIEPEEDDAQILHEDDEIFVAEKLNRASESPAQVQEIAEEVPESQPDEKPKKNASKRKKPEPEKGGQDEFLF